MLVLQEVVQDVDGRLAGEEHLNNEVGGAAIDGDERARRVGTLDQRHQHLQPHSMETYKTRAPDSQTCIADSEDMLPYLVRHIAHEDLLQSQEIHFSNGEHMKNAPRHNCRDIQSFYVCVSCLFVVN